MENASPVPLIWTVEVWTEAKLPCNPFVRPEFVSIHYLVLITWIVLLVPTVTGMVDVLLVPLEPVAESTMDLQELMRIWCLDNLFVTWVFVRIVI